MVAVTTKEIQSIGSDWDNILIKGDCLEEIQKLIDKGVHYIW